MLEFVWAAMASTVVFMAKLLCVVLLEHIGPRQTLSWTERLPGLLMNAALPGLTMLLMLPIDALWQTLGIARVVTIPLASWLAPLGYFGIALQILITVMLLDFLAYWRHRFEHRVLWRIHAVHHSPRNLHAANDLGHPLQAFYSLFFIALPMTLIQFDGPQVPAAVTTIIFLMSVYIHSPVEVHAGPLQRFIVDNRFHRIHHSLEERHFDRNFSICFSCWDYLFGTAYTPGEEWPETGLADDPPPRTLREYLLFPFRSSTLALDPETSGASQLGR